MWHPNKTITLLVGGTLVMPLAPNDLKKRVADNIGLIETILATSIGVIKYFETDQFLCAIFYPGLQTGFTNKWNNLLKFY